MLLAAALAVLGTLAGGAYWLSRPTVLVMAVGPPESPEFRFAERLSAILEQNHASVRLKLAAHGNSALALAQFAHHDADLTVLRTDWRIPPQARALAVLEHEILLMIGRPDAGAAGPADLKGRRLAMLGDDPRNEGIFRQVLEMYRLDGHGGGLQMVPATAPIDQLLLSGSFDAVLAVEPLSYLAKSRFFENLARRMDGFTLYPMTGSKALQRRVPGLYAETIEAGLLSGEPVIPADDLEAVGVRKLLVARSKVSEAAVIELMRNLFENKGELSGNPYFARSIEPPDTDKEAVVPAHDGAVEYVDDEVQSFFDRYSDLVYLGLSLGSVLGSVGFAMFTSATRVRPRMASERAADLLDLVDRLRLADSVAALDLAEIELEDVLRDILRGLKDGTVVPKGLDAFRMAYEHARDELRRRRAVLAARDMAAPRQPTA